MVTPTFVFSLTIVTMAVLAFGTTQTYLRFSSSGGNKGCAVSPCPSPGASRSAAAPDPDPVQSAAAPRVTASGGTHHDGSAVHREPQHAHVSEVSVAYRTVQITPGGFIGTISITIRDGQSASDWRLWIKFPGVRIIWMNGATWVPGHDDWGTVEPLPMAPPLRAGQPLAVMFTASGQPSVPSDCSFDNVSCHISG
jgi:hypothetical protein